MLSGRVLNICEGKASGAEIVDSRLSTFEEIKAAMPHSTFFITLREVCGKRCASGNKSSMHTHHLSLPDTCTPMSSCLMYEHRIYSENDFASSSNGGRRVTDHPESGLSLMLKSTDLIRLRKSRDMRASSKYLFINNATSLLLGLAVLGLSSDFVPLVGNGKRKIVPG